MSQDIGPLTSCSTDCSITITQLDFICDDNGTPSDASDDFYVVSINASAINGSSNNTYNVYINNILTYNFTYDEISQFNLPADGSSPLIGVVDNEDPACQVSQNIGPLNSCSDLCVLNAVVANIICDDMGTGDDPDDDTFTFDLTVTGVNNSTGWVTDVGGFSGTYGTTENLGPFLIINGDQTLTILDDADPSCFTSITVEAPEECSSCSAVIDAGPDALLTCAIDSTQLVGATSEAGTYTWTGPNSFVANTLVVTVYNPGWYYLEGQYASSCEAIDSVFVDINDILPTVDAGDEATITCQTFEVTLNGSGSTNSGNTTFEWFNQGGVQIGDTSVITVTETGTYTLYVIDEDNGCIASDQVIVSPDAELPIADAGQSSILDCNVLNAILDGSNSSTGSNIVYEWIDENDEFVSDSVIASVTLPGVYTLIVTDEGNDCVATSSVEISQDLTPPVADAGPDGLLTCEDVETTLDGSNSSGNGALDFVWINSNGDTIGNISNIIVSEGGTYTLVVTDDSNGCTASSEVEVLVDDNLPVPDALATGIVNCYELPVTLDGSNSSGVGVLEYEWIDPNSQSIGIDPVIDVFESGTYILIITDTSNGCTAQTTVDVDQNFNAPIADAVSSGNIDCENPTVFLDGSNSTGIGTISFEWQNSAGNTISTEEIAEVGSAGTYQLIVTDTESGCTDSEFITVDENPDVPVIGTTISGPITCSNLVTILDGSGSTPSGNLQFEWQDLIGNVLSDSASVEVTSSGSYILIVTNLDNGCSAQETLLVDENIELPNAEATVSNELDCVNTEATLDGSNSTGDGTLTYQWFNSNLDLIGTDVTTIVNSAGTYSLVVTDQGNGCTASINVEVEADGDLPSPEVEVTGVVNCYNQPVTLDASNSSSSGTLEFEWFDPNSQSIGIDPVIDVSVSGTYTLVITDQSNGCSATTTANVDQNLNEPTAEAVSSGAIDCDNPTVFLDGSNSTGIGTISFEWLNSAGNTISTEEITEVGSAGTYQLIVTDTESGCTDSEFITIDENPDVPVIGTTISGPITCSNLVTILDGSGSTPSGNLQFEWQDLIGNVLSDSASVEVTSSGSYILIVTNLDNGCSAQETLLVR